jgi:tetratricopeptide (TPR) repeat protein
MLKRLLSALLGKASATSSKNSAQNAHDSFDAADYAAALIAYETLFIATKEPQHLVNSGYCELMLGQLDLARTSFRRAHALAPHLAQALIGLGDVAARQQSHAEAVACYDRALAIDAQLAIARNNRSQSLTALGRLEEAWRDAEARYLTPGATSLYPHRLALPVWDGRSACRLLVHWEQGLGDIIQHLRFLPEAARRAGQCSFECPPPLLSVAQGLAGSLTLIAANSHAPDTGAGAELSRRRFVIGAGSALALGSTFGLSRLRRRRRRRQGALRLWRRERRPAVRSRHHLDPCESPVRSGAAPVGGGARCGLLQPGEVGHGDGRPGARQHGEGGRHRPAARHQLFLSLQERLGRLRDGPHAHAARRERPAGQARRVFVRGFPIGQFHVYNHASNRSDLDAALMLGDYIYENGLTDVEQLAARAFGRESDPRANSTRSTSTACATSAITPMPTCAACAATCR